MMVWPARVITADHAYRTARFVFEDGVAQIIDRKGRRIYATLEAPVQVADPSGERRWWFTADGTTWLVEQDKGCGCGGTAETDTTSAQRDLLTVPL